MKGLSVRRLRILPILVRSITPMTEISEVTWSWLTKRPVSGPMAKAMACGAMMWRRTCHLVRPKERAASIWSRPMLSMAGPETTEALRELSARFDEVARPAHGTYVDHPRLA